MIHFFNNITGSLTLKHFTISGSEVNIDTVVYELYNAYADPSTTTQVYNPYFSLTSSGNIAFDLTFYLHPYAASTIFTGSLMLGENTYTRSLSPMESSDGQGKYQFVQQVQMPLAGFNQGSSDVIFTLSR